jgi:aspartyl/asparaginyl beta-hydroxylase (cupin superfamily)
MSGAAGSVLEQAKAALQTGNPAAARSLVEAAAAGGADVTAAWLGVALSSRMLGDLVATVAAADKVLVREPAHPRALLLKADALHDSGDTYRALGCYRRFTQALPAGVALPSDLQDGLQRAGARLEQHAAAYADFLMTALSERGYRPGTLRRFDEALDICLGRRQVYYQQPRQFYFPGLPQRQFYEREEFPWLPQLEAETAAIREELLDLIADDRRFQPYLQSGSMEVGPAGQAIADNPAWGACYLWEYGRLVPENAARCPRTVQALRQVPMPRVPGQLPIALFSRLKPGTHIPPHHGLLNARLICHLPLIVPEDCGMLRVGNEARPWVEGQALIFDDSIEHEAWNRSGRDRIVLLFDIWRPELTGDERELVAAILEAVRRFHSDQSE